MYAHAAFVREKLTVMEIRPRLQRMYLAFYLSFFRSFQILAAMRKELANSGLSEEEILAKTMLLQKALAGDNSPAFVNNTIKSALTAAQISPNDLAKVNSNTH